MFAAKTKPCSSGQSRGSRNPLRDAIARLPPLGIPRLQAGEDVKQEDRNVEKSVKKKRSKIRKKFD